MKWTIRLELTPSNPPITYDIGTITRRIADLSPEEIGLTLEEGQQLLRRVQVQIIGSQAHAYALCRRPGCIVGSPGALRTSALSAFNIFFGAFRFRGRRYRSCSCRDHRDGIANASRWVKSFRGGQRQRYAICSPNSGSRMPYRAASRILKVCGFGDMRASHMAIRRHTLAIGRELEAQRLDAADGQAIQAPRPPSPW